MMEAEQNLIGDALLQRNYLNAYAVRDIKTTARKLAREMDIEAEVFNGWLRDERFRDMLREADLAQVAAAREIAFRNLAAIIDNVVTVAKGSRRASMRAADMVAKMCGLYPQAEGSKVVVNTGARVVVDDPAAVLRALAEQQRILADRGVALTLPGEGVADGNGHRGGSGTAT